MPAFTAIIGLLGINPFVELPARVVNALLKASGRTKGPVPIRGTLNGGAYRANAVFYSGLWRLYLNLPMRKSAGADVGDTLEVEAVFDDKARPEAMHPDFAAAFAKSKKARAAFEKLAPSRKKEILRYVGNVKREETRARNIAKAIAHLEGKPVEGAIALTYKRAAS
jgi:hypothetical protein